MWERVQLHWRAETRPGGGPAPEWLVTNGIGGFASGTTLGHHTRRYHGWLVAALKPPVRRTLLWVKSEERLRVGDKVWPLSTNDYGDTIHPDGWTHIHSFRAYPFPTTVYYAGGIVLERTIFMVRGQNTTAVVYRLASGPPDTVLVLQPLINCRDYHHTVRANDWPFSQRPWEHGVEIVAYPGAPPLVLGAGGPGAMLAEYRREGVWYHHFHYAIERERGLDFMEDHFRPGEFRWTMRGPGDVAVIVGHCPRPEACREPPWGDGPAALAEWTLERLAEATTRRKWLGRRAVEMRQTFGPDDEASHDPDWLRLVLAADDFVVRRETTGAATVIAGYPWFADWGRDAMISLPGLLLETGRFEEAREVLLTFAEHRADGLVPNRFPDDGGEPLYNAVDASLWWICAAWTYWRTTRDVRAEAELFPVMVDIVESFIRGTRHGIGIDADGLVTAADPGLQLTWMDAKVGDWVVTPRYGAPVEVNALWYNALRTVARLSALWKPAEAGKWRAAADAVGRAFRRRFVRFDGTLYDVVPPVAHSGAMAARTTGMPALNCVAGVVRGRDVVQETAGSPEAGLVPEAGGVPEAGAASQAGVVPQTGGASKGGAARLTGAARLAGAAPEAGAASEAGAARPASPALEADAAAKSGVESLSPYAARNGDVHSGAGSAFGLAGKPDASLRPNQIFAVSLPFPVLTGREARRVVRAVAGELLTPVGLRTLSPADPGYRGGYGGDQIERDGAYHQGTVWPWLLGSFVVAARRAAPELAFWPDAMRVHLRREAALGHVSEIFDGNAPHVPRGCFAQAWSVAEWLRTWSAPDSDVRRLRGERRLP